MLFVQGFVDMSMFCAIMYHDGQSGYNATIFAYGQTGSGKTHTMMSLGDGRCLWRPSMFYG